LRSLWVHPYAMREPADVDAPTGSAPKLELVRHAKGSFELATFLRERSRAVVVVGLLILGFVLVLLGWYGASHTNIVSEQIPYLISGGLLGLGLIIVSGFMASSLMNAPHQDLRRDDSVGRAPSSAAAAAPPAGGTVHVVPGGKGYHLAGCPIIEAKQGVREMRLIQAVDGGYVSCKLCSPD